MTRKLVALTVALAWAGGAPHLARGDLWTQQAKLTAAGADAGDNWGHAAVLEGDTAVVGAKHADVAGDRSGSACVFTRSAGLWSQSARLTPSDLQPVDLFGYDADISGDTVVVGAALGDHSGRTDAGTVYVFDKPTGGWADMAETAKLTAADADNEDNLGYSVAIDGDTVVAGALLDDERGADAGAAYVFTRSGGVWSQQAKLTASDAAADASFGYSVDLQGDWAIVGSHWADAAGYRSGAAYVFHCDGGVWTEDARLVASDGAAGDRFGISVAIEGDTAFVGAYLDDDAGDKSGSAYVFERDAGGWTEAAKLTASDAEALDRFGVSVALDGDRAAVGAYYDDGSRGSAYLFESLAGTWTETARLLAADRDSDDLFGRRVDVSGDTVIVSAYMDDTSAGPDTGSAYIFIPEPAALALLGLGAAGLLLKRRRHVRTRGSGGSRLRLRRSGVSAGFSAGNADKAGRGVPASAEK